jgi:3-oxoacyl-[acyl-carrier protein] reductase
MIASRNPEQLAATAAEIAGQSSAEVASCPADVSREEDVARLLETTRERFGPVDVLLTNSGGPPAGDFDSHDDAAWLDAFELLVLSSIRLIRGVLPDMRRRGHGRILAVASTSVKQPIPGLILSNSLRLAVVGMLKTLAPEVASDGVLVNVLNPGRFATERVAGLDAGRAASAGTTVEEVRARQQQGIPLGRYGTPEEFGRLAAFLLSPANSYVTGQSLHIDGGLVRAL